jgi:hypothetical protein
LTSALYGGEWSASRPGLFTPRERAPGIHRIGGPRAVLDTVAKTKNIYGHSKEEVTERENYIISFITYTLHLILFERTYKAEQDEWDMKQAWGK